MLSIKKITKFFWSFRGYSLVLEVVQKIEANYPEARIIFTFSLIICFQRMSLAGNLASRYLNALSFHSYKKMRTIIAYCKEKRLIGLNLFVYLQAYEFQWERYIPWTKFHCHVLEMWEKHEICVWVLILQIIEAN